MGKPRRTRKTNPWSDTEIRQLKKIFRNMPTSDVASELNRSVASVQSKATLLGLTKTKKYLKSIGKA